MKYLRKFEESIKDNSLLPQDAKFNIGEYVQIKYGKSYKQYYKQVFKIISAEINDNKILWGIETLYTPKVTLYFYSKDLRKTIKKEIQNYLIELDAKKYNL